MIADAEETHSARGGGVHLSGAAEALTAFARALNLPVAHTMTGKGAIPCIDPLNGGAVRALFRIANEIIAESDLIVVLGCKLGEIATKRFTVHAGRQDDQCTSTSSPKNSAGPCGRR